MRLSLGKQNALLGVNSVQTEQDKVGLLSLIIQGPLERALQWQKQQMSSLFPLGVTANGVGYFPRQNTDFMIIKNSGSVEMAAFRGYPLLS